MKSGLSSYNTFYKKVLNIMASTNNNESGERREVQASVLHGAKDLKVETRTLGVPEPTEVQVAVQATGLCGSDLHYYNHYRNGDIIVRVPMTLGHESAGIVTAVGSDVSNLKV
ncbi:hypothetical protein BOTNAR_0651g00030 [Botryotinia narcissicola]|uniref:Alcohol dehydrogenase-like N-terminal domain-containing protein n=1 Tax=Botryotinia narcissicola TaxID=278944 RepID=A0A4Z1H9C2_9HELO|nr:hypothetical protein BOTNAR_0651g00030 [Botryotinia narcissicola]